MADFYLDAIYGNDENDGLTPQTAWRTVKKLLEEMIKDPERFRGKEVFLNDGLYVLHQNDIQYLYDTYSSQLPYYKDFEGNRIYVSFPLLTSFTLRGNGALRTKIILETYCGKYGFAPFIDWIEVTIRDIWLRTRYASCFITSYLMYNIGGSTQYSVEWRNNSCIINLENVVIDNDSSNEVSFIKAYEIRTPVRNLLSGPNGVINMINVAIGSHLGCTATITGDYYYFNNVHLDENAQLDVGKYEKVRTSLIYRDIGDVNKGSDLGRWVSNNYDLLFNPYSLEYDTDYFVIDPVHGDDKNNGKTVVSAWRTLKPLTEKLVDYENDKGIFEVWILGEVRVSTWKDAKWVASKSFYNDVYKCGLFITRRIRFKGNSPNSKLIFDYSSLPVKGNNCINLASEIYTPSENEELDTLTIIADGKNWIVPVEVEYENIAIELRNVSSTVFFANSLLTSLSGSIVPVRMKQTTLFRIEGISPFNGECLVTSNYFVWDFVEEDKATYILNEDTYHTLRKTNPEHYVSKLNPQATDYMLIYYAKGLSDFAKNYVPTDNIDVVLSQYREVYNTYYVNQIIKWRDLPSYITLIGGVNYMVNVPSSLQTHKDVINLFRLDYGEEQSEIVTDDVLLTWIKEFYYDLSKVVPNVEIVKLIYTKGGIKLPRQVYNILKIKGYSQLDITRDWEEWENNDYVWYIDGSRTLHIKPDQDTELLCLVEKVYDTTNVSLESTILIPDLWSELITTYLKMKLCIRYEDIDKASTYAQLLKGLLNQYKEWVNRGYEVNMEWRRE